MEAQPRQLVCPGQAVSLSYNLERDFSVIELKNGAGRRVETRPLHSNFSVWIERVDESNEIVGDVSGSEEYEQVSPMCLSV